jgi:hypothetical protein
LEALMFAARLLCLLAGYSLSCLGAGAAVRRSLSRVLRADATPISPLGLLATDFLLGQGIFASVWLSLALAGRFSPVATGAVLCLSLLGLGFEFTDASAGARQVRSVAKELFAGPPSQVILALVTVAWILMGFTALTESLSGDSLNLHMLIPKVVAHSQVLTNEFFNARNTYFGLQGEMHHALLLSLGSQDAAKLFSWPTMMAGALMLVSICARCGAGRPGKWLGLILLYTTSGVIWWIGEGKVDIYSTALGLAAVYWLLPGPRSRLGLALGGAFAAFAVQAKLAYGLTLVPLLAFLYSWPWVAELAAVLRRLDRTAQQTLRRATLPLLLTLGAFLLAMIPHLAKNLFLFGNVVGSVESRTLPAFLEEPWYGPAVRTRIQLLYPLVLTFGEFFAQYGTLSPLVLAFLPLSVLLGRDPRPLGERVLLPLSLSPLLAVIPWMIAHADKVVTRYLLVPLLLWIPLAAVAAERAGFWQSPSLGTLPGRVRGLSKRTLPWILAGIVAWRIQSLPPGVERYFVGSGAIFALLAYRDTLAAPGRPWQARSLGFVIVLVSFVVLWSTVFRFTNYMFFPERTLLYLAGKVRFCDFQWDWCRASEVANDSAPWGARLFSTTTYKYFLRPDLIECSNKGDDDRQILGSRTPADARTALLRRGFGYLLLDTRDSGSGFLSEAIVQSGSDGEVRPLFAEGTLTLYKILPRDAPAPTYECRQIRPPGWAVVERNTH